MRRVVAALAVVLVALGVLGACGKDDPTAVGDEATSALAPHVEQMRHAAAMHDAAGVAAHLAALRNAVALLLEDGKLTPKAAAAIEAEAAAVEQQTALITTTTTTSPPPVISVQIGNNDRGDEKGRDKKDRDDDD